jgi:predicted dehydrogenase
VDGVRQSAVIIGAGRMAQFHEGAYIDCGVEVLHHADRTNWRNLIETYRPTYVSVTSWDDAHFEQTMYALGRGCKVLVEKPLCLHEDDLWALSETTGLFHCNLPLSKLKLQPHGYHYEADYLWGRASQLSGWRRECPDYSFVHGAGIHVVDTVLRNTAGRRIVEVAAFGDKTHGFPNYTMVTAIGRLENFGTVRFDINAAYDGDHHHRFVSWTGDGKQEILNTASDKTRVLKDLLEGGESNRNEAIAASAVCFAIERSLARGGTPEKVNYP